MVTNTLQAATPINTSPLSDEEIAGRVLAGETALYEILMRRHNQRLFRIAYGILGDSDEAEDVMQEAYVRAYTFLYQFEGRAQFSTWLAKIAVYEASSRLEKRKRLDALPINSPQEKEAMESMRSFGDPGQECLSHEAGSFLEQAIHALPDIYRTVFMCREVEEMSTAETANCLDLTEEAVKVRLHRARQMLQNELYARAGATSSQAFQFMGKRCDRVVRLVLEKLAELRNARGFSITATASSPETSPMESE
jgi:RNA polymerase sigma-70 factor (ECF subfamily)